jgi:cobaltochelatase CobN
MSPSEPAFRGVKLAQTSARLLAAILFFIFAVPVSAAPFHISLVIDDNHSKNTIEAVKDIERSYPDIRGKIDFQILPTLNIVTGHASPMLLASPETVCIMHIMDSRVVEAMKSYVAGVVRNKGKVYGVAGAYSQKDKDMGITDDKTINAYWKENGEENIRNMILFVMNRDFGLDVAYKERVSVPDFGIYLKKEKKIVTSMDEFARDYRAKNLRPWIGVIFYKTSCDSGNMAVIDCLIDRLEEDGFNVIPVYGYPMETAIEKYFFDEKGKSRINALVGLSLKVGLRPQIAVPLLSRLDVPVIDAITLATQSRDEWQSSAVGLDTFERTWQVAVPELAGIIQPTVISSKEKAADKETGIEYVEEKPLPARIARLAGRIRAWVNLQQKPDKDKRIALIYYNYPPGKQDIGASYLNVLPESLYEMLARLKSEGYDTGDRRADKERLFNDVFNYGRNIGNWAPAEIDRLARSGKAVLVPVDTYKRWFDELPPVLKKSIIDKWGKPEDSNIMTWRGASGTKYIVIPAIKYGNIVLTPQPSRGWEQDPEKLYHDVSIPPHHQYVAFYLWLKNVFKADAVVHIGTHGTLEWLSGKEVGFTDGDPPEALIQDMPDIYPYIIDDVGEGLQAKRRGMAVVIDHMSPPFDKAGMNKELKDIVSLISDYRVAAGKSPALAESKLNEMNALLKKTGMLKDLGIAEVKTSEDVEQVEDYIEDISGKQTPFGLHTFGRSPEEKYIKTTAEALLSVEKGMPDEERKRKTAGMEDRIVRSGKEELDSFIAALSGRYVVAGSGNDPIRNPDSLPSGKNFYAFDPTRIPAKGTYELGAKLAGELINGYKKKHGNYPDKITMNLWGTETIANEGVMESQIMYLMGVKPKWDERGRVAGVEIIKRDELGRPRIDVTIVPSGLYRDLFSNLMDLLDRGVTLAKEQDERDNAVRGDMLKTKKMLIEKGIPEDRAERLASVRIFSEPPGAYGTNLDKVIQLSDTWEDEKKVIDVYFMRLSTLYGQGFWGDRIEQKNERGPGREDISLALFKNALSGTKIVVHSRTDNVFATLDNDDFFQYVGGTAMAVRVVDGKTPEVYVSNLSNPKRPVQETLDKFMGREMRSRYLNPEWIKAMMKEGYSGARFVDKVVDNLWGWQVTVPEAVDAAKWNEMYETYVLDRNGLDIKKLFRQSKNMFAYQSLVARMLETIRKKYWKPDKKIVDMLAKEYAESVQEVGLACCEHTCNNPMLTQFTQATLLSIPGLYPLERTFVKAHEAIKQPQSGGDSAGQQAMREAGAERAPESAPKDSGKAKAVQGYEMKESTTAAGLSSAPIPWMFIGGFMVFIGLVAVGFRRRLK